MRIAIIDADLIGRKRHRFPNLACMKLAGYHREQGDDVRLKTDYEDLEGYDKIYLSKVFTDTPVPKDILEIPTVQYGGTGFYYDKAEPLPEDVEHHKPDYGLYMEWVEAQIGNGKSQREFAYYLDYSIGFLSRGCFRKCAFCVNRNYDHAFVHSPLEEFLDVSRPKVCLLDDNFFACPQWKALLNELRAVKKPFQFKQGLDERLLTDEKCSLLFSSRYDGDFIFAFDDLAESNIIIEKLKLIRKYTSRIPKFYCFTGYDRNGIWDDAFWKRDIGELFARIEILMRYRCLPYVMRFARYQESPYRSLYINIARWCNQPAMFKKTTLREFARMKGEKSSYMKSILDFERKNPEMTYYLDLRYEDVAEAKCG